MTWLPIAPDQDLMTTSDKLSPSPDYFDFSVGSIVFDRFEILDEVASGAQGRVFKAKDLLLDNTVALKVLLSTTGNDRDIVRFQHEARLASKMKHQCIATIYDFGILENTPFLSMEFVAGESLEAILERDRTLPLLDLLEIFLQVCDAIQHAHAAGIIHRDIKPSNIIVSKSEDGTTRAKVLDFGVAKTLDVIQESKGKLTPTGNLVGSPFYMSPEQSKGQSATTKSDNYSLGCVMWTSLVGEPPFVGENVMETLLRHANETPPKLSTLVDDEIPLALTELIDGLLAKNPDDRPDLKTVVIPSLVELLNNCIADLHRAALAKETEGADTIDSASEKVAFWKSTKLWLGVTCFVFLVFIGYAIEFQADRNAQIEKTVSVAATSNDDFLNGFKVDTDIDGESLNRATRERYFEKVRNGTKHDLSLGFDLKKETLLECTRLPGLWRLDLTVASVYDSDIGVIAKIPNLKYLSLNMTQVKTLDGIDKVSKLEGLELKKTAIDNLALKNVAKLRKLEILNLTHTNVDDEGIKYLVGMPNLRDLNLSGVSINAKSAKYIKTLPRLEVLRLRESDISEAVLREILGMDSLRMVYLENCKSIDEKHLLQLRLDFPTVKFPPESSIVEWLDKHADEAIKKDDQKVLFGKLSEIIRLLKRRYGKDSALVAGYSTRLAVCAALLGKQSEAIGLAEDAIRIAKLKNNSDLLLTALNSKLAVLETLELGSNQQFIDLEETMLKLEQTVFGANSAIVAHRIVRIADHYLINKQYLKALQLVESNQAFKNGLSSKSADVFIETTMKYAECLRYAGHYKAACLKYKIAQDKLESIVTLTPGERDWLFIVYLGRAASELNLHRFGESLKYNDKAMALTTRDFYRVSLPGRISMNRQRAELLELTGQHAEAEKIREKVLKLEAIKRSREKTKALKEGNKVDAPNNVSKDAH